MSSIDFESSSVKKETFFLVIVIHVVLFYNGYLEI